MTTKQLIEEAVGRIIDSAIAESIINPDDERLLIETGYELEHILRPILEKELPAIASKSVEVDRYRILAMVKERHDILFPDGSWKKITNEAPSDHKVFGQKEIFDWILKTLSPKVQQ